MGSIWLGSGQIVWTNSGARAVGAKAYFYDAGTTTPKVVYQDGDETTAHPNPVVADGNGRWPAVYVPFGDYKTVITTSGGAAIGPTIDDIPNPAPTDPGEGVAAESLLTTGDVWWSPVDGTRTGAVRLNGRSIGNASSSATERANADTENLFIFCWNGMADAVAAVSGGRGATGAADFAANKRLTLPDLRGSFPGGLATMGNTNGGSLASAPVVAGSVTTAGSVVGSNTHTLTSSEMPAHTHTGTSDSGGSHTHTGTTDSGGTHSHSGTTSSDGSHVHGFPYGNAGASAGGVTFMNDNGGPFNKNTDAGGTHSHIITTDSGGAHTHTFTTASGGSHTHTFTTASTGGGGAHNNLSRTVLGTWFIRL